MYLYVCVYVCVYMCMYVCMYVCTYDGRAFFKYVGSKLNGRSQEIQLIINDEAISDRVAADALMLEFCRNFASVTDASACLVDNVHKTSRFQTNCQELIVAEAIANCSASNASPDSISYSFLKKFSQYLVRPLNIVFQQSMFVRKFPSMWKHTIIILLYKGRGDRLPSSYRPISLCSCAGKLLEHIMQGQLMAYFNSNDLLRKYQHGFTAGTVYRD